MWHPQPWQWPGPAAPESYWGWRGEAPQTQARPDEPRQLEGARKPRSAAKAQAAKATRGEARAAKQKAFRNRGIASWYGKRFHGRKTASGERYNMYAMTAAHRTLPLPSYVRVTNPANGSSVVVLVNDRGPYVGNRVIDLSYAAASALGIVKRGTAVVELEVIPNALPALASAEDATATAVPAPLADFAATAID